MMDDDMGGVNYLDDLLNEMTKDTMEFEEEPPKKAAAPPTQAPSARVELARPQSFRGDFDYLEALLSDIAPPQTENVEQTQVEQDDTPTQHVPRRPPSMAPRATAAFDLESTLKDLEDTFYNGLEGASLKRTTSVISWPKDSPDPNKREEYMDVLDELVSMDVGDTNVTKVAPTPPKPHIETTPTHTTPPPTKEASVLDQMIEAFAGEPQEKKKAPATSPPPQVHNAEKARKVDEDISYLDQMLNSFIGSDIAQEEPVPKPNKTKGTQVKTESPTEVPRATKDPTTTYMLPRSHSSVSIHLPPVRKEPEPSRVSRAPVPAAASVAAPAKIPALRSTATFTTLGRATVNMDDLLDQVIHSIVSEDSGKGNAGKKQPPQTNKAQSTQASKGQPSEEDEEVMSQIFSNQELNIIKLERKAHGSTGRDWMVPFSEFEPLLQAKLGIGNHGEAYRPGIWRGTRVVVKRWNTSLSLTFPLQEEITALVSLSHPNLVPVLGACGDGRGLYSISEYIPGANLHGFLHNGGLSVEMYDSQYIAPELMRGAQYTMQVDVYSFGVMLWEAFAGESAHDGLVLRDLNGCPYQKSFLKLIKLCVAASAPARPTFSTVVKILSQPMETLLKYSRPASAVGDSGFFNPPSSRNSTSVQQPYSAPQGRAHSVFMDAPPVERLVDEEAEDKKLQKVLYALSDLIRTPSDHAQIRAINAIESLATKEWNVSRMVAHGFVSHIIDLLRSKFVDVQETTARVIATMLKNPELCQNFLRSGGIGALFDLLGGPDDGVRLVAAKALTVAAYTTPELTRTEAHLRNGGAALAALLRADNEFVRVQTAWALGQLLAPGHPLVDAFHAADGVPLVCSLLITGGSPAAELRALSALLPLLATPHARAAVPSSVPRKVSLLLSSPQPPLRSQALQAASLLVADKNSVPILLEGHGLSVALLALIQPPLNNPLLLQALDLLRNIAEIPAHAAILVRAGLREALHPHLATTDATVMKSANVLYNLLV